MKFLFAVTILYIALSNSEVLGACQSSSDCGSGSLCLSSNCVKDTPCHSKLLSAQNNNMVGGFRPRCLENGEYHPVQCFGSVCYCADNDGSKIRNYEANIGFFGEMTCKCARDQHVYQKTRMIGKMFRCHDNGNYHPIQCMGSVCFCADENGKKRDGSDTVHIAEQDKLKC